jgi:uncharacterized OB-fold protein
VNTPDLETDALQFEPVDESEGEPRLVAGRCSSCGEVTFPFRPTCPSCGGELRRELLPREGILWTWTVQGFEPKPPYVPEAPVFEPFGVGYVEFPGHLRVEGRLTEADPARLLIGMPMEVVTIRAGGRRTYAFAPIERNRS